MKTAVEWQGIQFGILISKFFNNEISKSDLHFKRLEIEEEAKKKENQLIEEYNYYKKYWEFRNKKK